MTARPDIKLVIDHLGGPTNVATALGLKWPSQVTNWIAREQIPAEYVVDIERLTEGKYDRHYLRPEIFGPPAPRARRKAAA